MTVFGWLDQEGDDSEESPWRLTIVGEEDRARRFTNREVGALLARGIRGLIEDLVGELDDGHE